MDREIQEPWIKGIDVIEQAQRAGLDLEPDGDTLHVSPKANLSDELRFLIKAHKPAMMRILKAEWDHGKPCKVCGWRGYTFDGWCEWCIDLVVEAERVGHEIVLVRV